MATLNTYLLRYISYTSKYFYHKIMVMMCLAHFPLFWNTILALLFSTWLLIVLLLITLDVHHIMILRWIIYDFYLYPVDIFYSYLSSLPPMIDSSWSILPHITHNYHLLSTISQVWIDFTYPLLVLVYTF